MNIGFRVDGNSTIGLGHLMRCLALAQTACQYGKVTFFTQNSSIEHCLQRHDWVGDIIEIPSGNFDLMPDARSALQVKDIPTELAEIEWLNENALRLNLDILICDGYQFNEAYRAELSKKLAQSPILLGFFDDNNDSGKLYADVVINGNAHAETLDYRVNAPHALLCLGAEFRVLRLEFYDKPDVKTLPHQASENITIMMGGADPQNLTSKIAQYLLTHHHDCRLNIVTGSAFSRLSEVEKLASEYSERVIHLHNHQAIAQLFQQSSLVISAGGSTQYELQATCTPAVLLVVAENQLLASQQSQSNGLCHVIDCRNQINELMLFQAILDVINDKRALNTMATKMKAKARSNGAENIIKALKIKCLANK